MSCPFCLAGEQLERLKSNYSGSNLCVANNLLSNLVGSSCKKKLGISVLAIALQL